MNIWPIVLLAVAYGICVVLYCIKPIRRRFKSAQSLLDIINAVTALSVFVSLYYTVSQFKQARDEQATRDLQALVQSLDALDMELEGNISACDNILAEENLYTNALAVPQQTFHVDVLRHALTTGQLADSRLSAAIPEEFAAKSVTTRSLNATLYNTFHKMLLLNDSISKHVDIMALATLAKVDDQLRFQYNWRLKTDMPTIVNDSRAIRETLKECKRVIAGIRDNLAKEFTQDK